MAGNKILEETARSILTRAVSLDKSERYTESLVCYQEGLQILLELMKVIPQGQKEAMRKKIEEYMGRAEKIKKNVEEKKSLGTYHEQIKIEEDSTGHSYEMVMGRFLDDDVVSLKVEDPYIKNWNQFLNLVNLCELALKKCRNLKHVYVLTGKGSDEQLTWFQYLETDLKNNHQIQLDIKFSTTLHDRQIILSNGWIIKIGRGLDYFKVMDKHCYIGHGDRHFRHCRETTVDIFHSGDLKK